MKPQKWKEKKMDRKTKQELNELSKQVFGSSSKWQKLVERGSLEPMQRERKVMVPENGSAVEKTFIDRKTVMRRYTPDEIKSEMLSILDARDKQKTASDALEKKD